MDKKDLYFSFPIELNLSSLVAPYFILFSKIYTYHLLVEIKYIFKNIEAVKSCSHTCGIESE